MEGISLLRGKIEFLSRTKDSIKIDGYFAFSCRKCTGGNGQV